MTRINLVEPKQLTDKHLLAEYKEITRPFNKVSNRLAKGTMDDVKVPSSYCLGTGHETFFFDKLMWLFDRYCCLYEELCKRNFTINHNLFSEVSRSFRENLSNTPYWKWYTPAPEEIYLNFSRLAKRSKIQEVLKELSE